MLSFKTFSRLIISAIFYLPLTLAASQNLAPIYLLNTNPNSISRIGKRNSITPESSQNSEFRHYTIVLDIDLSNSISRSNTLKRSGTFDKNSPEWFNVASEKILAHMSLVSTKLNISPPSIPKTISNSTSSKPDFKKSPQLTTTPKNSPIISSSTVIGNYFSYDGYFDTDSIQKIRALPGTKYIQQITNIKLLPDNIDSKYSPASEKNTPSSTPNELVNPKRSLNTTQSNKRKCSSKEKFLISNSVHQEYPTWDLARLSSKNLPVYMYNSKLGFISPNTGEDVVVYVIDTGVNINHTEFGNRASFGGNYAYNLTTGALIEDSYDYHGHGTMVASLVAGASFGVAKKSRVISYKVATADGNGNVGSVIKALSDIAKDIAQAKDKRSASLVVCSFIHIGEYKPWNDALVEFTSLGYAYIAPAGNGSDNSCTKSPLMSHAAIVVGASNPMDLYHSSTSYGSCVDIFAPGTDITGALNTNNYGTTIKSGTSFSAPLVAGISSVILSQYPNLSPAQLKDKLLQYSIKDILPPNLPNTTRSLAQLPSFF
ncbi:Subtilase-type proteinase psp3 [Smittium culicis]|uniref:Subtilase-type proteinase psp3 n=1 Tax=Smittium culicis TaxID=133412 RepID=A0A1R1XA18_9FUNG|nr:Subtilase-type proteinase psp3 [Smittium culicis]